MTARTQPPAYPTEPPEHLDAERSSVWREVVARGRIAPTVDAMFLEVYCDVVVQYREASKAITADGSVIANEKGAAIVHPALTVQRQLAAQLKDWAPLFTKPKAAVRKRGTLYDATKASITASPEIHSERYEGVKAAALTLAWLIDEAARDGIDEIRKAAYVLIPSYVKACAELQITPASIPAEWLKEGKKGGKVSKFEDKVEERRNRAALAAAAQ